MFALILRFNVFVLTQIFMHFSIRMWYGFQFTWRGVFIGNLSNTCLFGTMLPSWRVFLWISTKKYIRTFARSTTPKTRFHLDQAPAGLWGTLLAKKTILCGHFRENMFSYRSYIVKKWTILSNTQYSSIPVTSISTVTADRRFY